MKFAFPNQGVGRFTKLGFPVPHFTATADAWLEIVGGTLLLAGFLTRLIAVPFIIEMLVAMASTKIPLYLGTSPLPLPPPSPPPPPPPYPSAKGRLLKSPSIAEPGVILGDVRVRSVHKIGYGHDRDGATA